MYCSSCGAAVKPNLSYCNHCGAALSGKERGANNSIEASQESLVWGLLAVTVGGLALMIGLMAVMKQVLNFGTGMIAGFTLLSFLLLLGAESVFIWLLVRSKRDAKKINGRKEHRVAQARAFPEPVMSVTEHTTRTLEPSASERKSE